MRLINSSDQDLTLGTIRSNLLYAVPFTNSYFDIVREVLTYFSFGSPLIGIYSDNNGYPDAQLLQLSSPIFNNSQALYNTNYTLPARSNYWFVALIDRETTFLGRVVTEKVIQDYFLPIYDTNTKIGGFGIAVNYSYSLGLPVSYPSGAQVIPINEFTPFFVINKDGFSGSVSNSGSGFSGFSGYSGSGNDFYPLIVASLGF